MASNHGACFTCASREEKIRKRWRKKSAFDSHKKVSSKTPSIPNLLVRSPITRMPPEILSEILSFAVGDENWVGGIYTINHVCRAFHMYAQTVLFRNITFLIQHENTSHSLAPACTHVQNLHSLIHADPVLRKYCKSLTFSLPYANSFNNLPKKKGSKKKTLDRTPEDYQFGTGLLLLLSKLRRIEVRGGFRHQTTWPFLTAAFNSLPLLESLKLKSGTRLNKFDDKESELLLPDVLKCIQGLKLSSLELKGIRIQHTASVWNIPEVVRTSTITSLILRDFHGPPEALKSLLGLPKGLEHFTFSAIRRRTSWSMDVIHHLLSDHRTTLKSIQIGALSRQGKPRAVNTFSVKEFPTLEKLHLSPWDIGWNMGWNMGGWYIGASPDVACEALLAPNLKHLVWDLNDVLNEEETNWDDFEVRARDWLLSFAKLAVKLRSQLKKIDIVFTPCSDIDEYETKRQIKRFWPWDLMDEVRDAVCPDIEVRYNDHISKEEYNEIIKAMRQDPDAYEESDEELGYGTSVWAR